MPFPTSSFAQSGQFRNIRPIGQGASGQVYYAEDNLGRPVAVKEALPSSQQFQATLAQFVQEARLQASLDHPNIVRVYALDMEPQTQEHYLVCEYANGGSLTQHLETYGALTEPQAIKVALDICAALERTAAQQVVHCDIKPLNILLFNDTQGQIVTAKLGDFGVAQDRAAQGTTIVAGTPYPGTPLYMAPEQSNRSNILDVRTDLYALGITLFEMLTLKDYKLLPATGGAPDLQALNPLASPGIAAVIRRAVQDDPRKRYQTPQDMATDLRGVLRGSVPTSPSGPVTASPPVPPSRPSRRPYFAFVTLLLLMVVAGIAAWLLHPMGAARAGGPAASTAAAGTTPSTVLESPTETAAPASQPTSAPAAAPAARVLDKVKARQRLRCGVGGTLPGFSYVDPSLPEPTSGDWNGFDVDFCHAVAAAVLGTKDAVEFVPLTADKRFPAVLNGDVDVLFRNTTWTSQRDTGVRQGVVGLDFGPTTFYDGQGFLVRADSKINSSADLAGQTVCVASNTTSESNLTDYFRQIGVAVVVRAFSTTDDVYKNYAARGCAAVTSDRSQLFVKLNCARSGKYKSCADLNPDEHKVLPEVMSKEPLGPVVVENDSQWRDVVSWAIFATIYGDELGVDQANVAEQVKSTTDRRIKTLLGSEGAAGKNLGLANDFAVGVIREVGNYSEIYKRNFLDTQLIPGDPGPNKAWNKGLGGVLSTPPFSRE